MIALCIGRREQGKTTLAYWLACFGCPRVIFDPRGMFGTSENVLTDSGQLGELLDDGEKEIIIQPAFYIPEHFENTCNELMGWVRENSDVPFAFLVDESYDAKTPEKMPVALDWLMRKTKREKTRIIFTAHRPGDISTDIRALSDHWFIFQTTQEHDLKVIRERCGSDVAEAVRHLSARTFIHWDDGKAKWEVWSDSRMWFVQIQRGVVAA
jgi:hypothetical protein